MRKTILGAVGKQAVAEEAQWLDLETIAKVEVSSEDELFPIEHALALEASTGWRASATGPQVVRLRFDEAQEVRRILIHVVERAVERMQEIGVFAEVGGEWREIRRQQFTFSPGGSTEEIEDFAVELNGVTMLELQIDPDRSHDPKQSRNYATLMALRVAGR
jgi:hypothetical protein